MGGFTETARETWLAESHIEQLRGQVEVSTESREKLQSWRRSKARQLVDLEQKVKRHQRIGHPDLENMFQEKQEKTEMLALMREMRRKEDEATDFAVSQYQEKISKERTKRQERRH